MTEAELQSRVGQICRELGLLVFHVKDARGCWGPGFPDLVIAGRRRLLFRELKATHGRLSADQTRWRYALTAADADWGLWYPADLEHGIIRAQLEAAAGQRVLF